MRARTNELEVANHEVGRAYQELQRAGVELVRAEKMASLGRLVAGVAHEINNPLSFIAGTIAPLRTCLERLGGVVPESGRKPLDEAEEIVEIIGRGAERTVAIVQDLRTFSRLDEAVRKETDLIEGLEVSLRLLITRLRDRIAVHRDYEKLPLVSCDGGQINQVFMNLLVNACDAIDGQGNLWLSARASDAVVTISIRDDGCGIAPDVREKLFEPFFTTKDVGKGTGMGLAICQAVVSAHGGRIEVEGEPGSGSTFRVVLPCNAAERAVEAIAVPRT